MRVDVWKHDLKSRLQGGGGRSKFVPGRTIYLTGCYFGSRRFVLLQPLTRFVLDEESPPTKHARHGATAVFLSHII